MTTSLVLTFIGPDKPGLVEQLSQSVAEHQGNWLESGLSRLAGKFAGILTVSVPSDQQESLKAALMKLEQEGFQISVESVEKIPEYEAHQVLSLELIGHDKPGIVRDISQALAQRHIVMEHLNTELVSGSMSAEELFKAQVELIAPVDADLDDLQDALEEIASDLMVDLTLHT